MADRPGDRDRRAAVIVDPAMARRWLDRSADQPHRGLDEGTVALYTQEMAAGRWRPDGPPVWVMSTGVVVDGVHRLSAICRLGRAVELAVDADWHG